MHLEEILARIESQLRALNISADKACTQANRPDAIRNLRRAVKTGGTRKGVSTATLIALAPVLKVTPEWLLNGGGAAERSREETITGPDAVDLDLFERLAVATLVELGHPEVQSRGLVAAWLKAARSLQTEPDDAQIQLLARHLVR